MEKRQKPAEIDELFDRYVNRRLASFVVRALHHTSVTPNQISLLAAAGGIFSGYCFARLTPGWVAIGGFSLLVTMILDCVDGQLARFRGVSSRAGRIMDGAADYTTAFSLHLGMCYYLIQRGLTAWEYEFGSIGIFLTVLAAGVSMAVHSAQYDYVKNRYLGLTGRGDNDVDDPEEVAEEYRQAEGIEKVFTGLYLIYCRMQNREQSEERAALEDPLSNGLRRRFGHRYRNNLYAWGLIGPTTHLVGITVAAILSWRNPEAFAWYIWAVLVPANVYMLGLKLWSYLLDRQLVAARGVQR